jgi:hypothetical protein
MHAPGNLEDSHKVALIVFINTVHDRRLLDPERGGVHGLRLGHVLGDVPLKHGGPVLGNVVLGLRDPGGNSAGGLGLLLQGLLLWGPVHQLNLVNQRNLICPERAKFRVVVPLLLLSKKKTEPTRLLPEKFPKRDSGTT